VRPDFKARVIASEAKQSILSFRGGMDCFVASLLAMTGMESNLSRRLAQAIAAQAIAAVDRHRQDGVFLGTPARSRDVAGEFRSASGTGEAARAGGFQTRVF
jgi:hypothetical protein